MTARKLLVLLGIGIFTLSFVGVDISAGMSHEALTGTVTKIEGGNVTIKDAAGAEKTVAPKNTDALGTLKVGDHVTFKDGSVTKEAGMMEKEGGMKPKSPHGGGY